MSSLTRFAKAVLPQRWYTRLKYAGRHARHFGLTRYCPICGSYLRGFIGAGPTRPDCECPVCGAFERQRLSWLFLTTHTDLFDGRPKSMLHVAPEYYFSDIFRRQPRLGYISIDIAAPTADILMDITALGFADDTFEVAFCSHVLEHVVDDRRAMAELFRVLKPGGWVLPDVPIFAERTFEDPSVTSPEARKQVFGQSDHVRKYGRDVKERLESVGFSVSLVPFGQQIDARRRQRLGLQTDDVYVCRKPPLQ